MEKTLWPHQAEEIEKYCFTRSRALFWEPRVGKTLAIIENMRRVAWYVASPGAAIAVNSAGLAAINAAGHFRALVICPKNVAHVWLSELAESWSAAAVIDCADGPLIDRRRIIDEETARRGTHKDPFPMLPCVIIVNDESLFNLARELRAWNPMFVVADESHRFKSAGARRSKALHRFSYVAFKRILTGTPDPQTYRDYYSQYKFLAPGVLAATQAEFDREFVNKHPIWQSKVVGYRNQPELHRRLFSVASRIRVAEARGVPDVHEVVRTIPLPGGARKSYDDLVANQIASIAGAKIDATHTLVRLLRLAQLTAGFVPDDMLPPGSPPKWLHTAKIDAVVGELGEILAAGKKAVVFFRFRPEGNALFAAIEGAHGAGTSLIDGQTPPKVRHELLDCFSKPTSNLRTLVIQEQIGSLGIDLSAADHCIFSTMSFDFATHLQGRQRIYKPEGKICYTYIIMHQTIDEFVLKTHRRKKSASRIMLDSDTFKRAALGDD